MVAILLKEKEGQLRQFLFMVAFLLKEKEGHLR
jgi:hypothetical protein